MGPRETAKNINEMKGKFELSDIKFIIAVTGLFILSDIIFIITVAGLFI